MDHNKDSIRKKKDAERKRIARQKYSDEKKEDIKRKQREYARKTRSERDVNWHVEHREASRKRMAHVRATMTEEELEECRNKNRERTRIARATMTEEELEECRNKDRERTRIARATMTEEELDEVRERNNERRRLAQYRANTMGNNEGNEVLHSMFIHDANIPITFNISDNVCIDRSIEECDRDLSKTVVLPEEAGYADNNEVHKVPVCVVCDCSIIGTEEFEWITMQCLRYHENVLSSQYHYTEGINPVLKSQYKVEKEELSHLLLSPRARFRSDLNSYTCCQKCYSSLCEMKRLKKPPKYAISNGFAIGHIPESISHNITPLINNLVAPVRAFNFFVSFNGGKEQKITGNFTFFAQDVAHNLGAMQHTTMVNNNPTIFIVLLGSFTTQQLDKIRTQGSYNVETFEKVYRFLHANNQNYHNLPIYEHIPMPRVEQVQLHEEEEACINLNSTNQNETSEENEICWRYWFPSVEDPNVTSGSYRNQSEFAKALFIGETPTLFYHPNKVISHAKLSQLCPLAFPFGTGDVDCKRKPAVTEVECLQHYLKLSLPQFLEGQTVLIIHHIFQRRHSFMTGIAKCNVSNNGLTIADQLAAMTVEELDNAITQMKKSSQESLTSPEYSPRVMELLKCVKTSCVPIGYTNEAAVEARSKMFALWMTFGPPSLLFTFSPCDECSFKMQLHATGKYEHLPTIQESVEILSCKLGIRRALRVQYPGACAREFDSLLQIVLSDLIGWNGKTYKRDGIFGRIVAYAIGNEEQGRTTLHGHIILWVLNYQNLQQQLFSSDAAIRERSKVELTKYLEKVLSSSFNLMEDEVKQAIHTVNDTCCSRDVGVEGVSMQTLREMRHIEFRKKHEGKVIICTECSNKWDTAQVVNGVIRNLYAKSREEDPTYWSNELTFPLHHEQMELIALRYQSDMRTISKEKVHTRRLLHLVALLFFNTHDWRHRKGCYKKGNECRFHLPRKPNEVFSIQYNTDNVDHLGNNNSTGCTSKWYHHDGTYHNVCSYEIQSHRKPWDVFVNTNNPTVSNIFGYNNNVCIGSINTLYYCTLYTSKSNQEDETYPYVKALEAVSHRLRRIEENSTEENLSSRQVGLRNLLSGINSHLSSCVVSATMAWYLVVHGSRFHFSHDFKPLLMTQLESWFHGSSFTRRIRYKKRKRQRQGQSNVNNPPGFQHNTGTNNVEDMEGANTWFESCVDNYIYRPSLRKDIFENMSIWEYESKYDIISFKAENFMAADEPHDTEEKYFRFDEQHPGYYYSCLVKRSSECIPKLYYSNKFPDIADLHIDLADDVSEETKELRETYALKALLLFLPFREKNDLQGNHESLWESFVYQKETYLSRSTTYQLGRPGLYLHAVAILQNIQDLLNVKKVPTGEEILQSCTSVPRSSVTENDECDHLDCEMQNMNTNSDLDVEAQIQQLAQYINSFSAENSIFNNADRQQEGNEHVRVDPSVISIQSSTISSQRLTTLDYDDGSEMNECNLFNMDVQAPANHSITDRPLRSIITVLTRALETTNVQTVPSINSQNSENMELETSILPIIDLSLQSMEQCAGTNNLDRKQSIAFHTICSSFIFSYLTEFSLSVPTSDFLMYHSLLRKKGAQKQLLMCLTGPGGSGKSHVVKCCRLYCKSFCNAIGKPFNFSVFPVTATSNAAASLINGITIHSAALLNNKYVQMDLSTDVDWTLSKVLIIDEISMADKNLFRKLDKNLRILTGNRDLLFGGIHIVYGGDFMQLAPVQGTPIYSSFDDILWHQSLNAAVFLDVTNHRFKNDPNWGEILQRVQIGQPTDDDIQVMNERLLSKVKLPDIVDCDKTKIVYGCYSNKQRNQITDACFLKYVMNNHPLFHTSMTPPETTLMIKGIVTIHNRDVGPDFHKVLWGTCGDDNIVVSQTTRIDPCLKLIQGCPLMITTNTEKKRDLVKGMTASYVGVRWKDGKCPHVEDYHGYKVNCGHVTDIECIILKLHTNGKHVELQPEIFQPSIKFPGMNKKSVIKGYHIMQFPVNQSLAVTGHKLQGTTVELLILAEINLTMNWLYVLLSRVTSLQGLYLMKPLKKSMFKPICNNLKLELEWLRGLERTLLNQMELN